MHPGSWLPAVLKNQMAARAIPCLIGQNYLLTRGQLYYEDVLAANLPEFLGGGPETAKPIFLKAQEKFEAFHNDDPFWPIWGENLNQDEMNRLNE